jgi:hypothetical protein
MWGLQPALRRGVVVVTFAVKPSAPDWNGKAGIDYSKPLHSGRDVPARFVMMAQRL